MKSFFISAFLIFSISLMAQKPVQGKVIPEYGKIFQTETDFKTDTTQVVKVVFDITSASESSDPSIYIASVARYLNMMVMDGVPEENMKLAVVIHGAAIFDLMKDKYYHMEYPDDSTNPNLGLLQALSDHDVQIITCGQSLAIRQIDKEMIFDKTAVALSAMTAVVQLQSQGYQLIKF